MSHRTSILLLSAMWKIVPNSNLSQCRESIASFYFKHRSQSSFLPFHHCAHIIFWLSLNWVHYSCNQPTHVLASTRKNWENRFLSMRRMKKFLKKIHSVIVAHWLGTFFHCHECSEWSCSMNMKFCNFTRASRYTKLNAALRPKWWIHVEFNINIYGCPSAYHVCGIDFISCPHSEAV